MQKTFTNGEVFNIAQIIFGDNGLLAKKHLKTRMAVRQAMKFNSLSIMSAYNTINEMMQDIIKELMEEFTKEEKAVKNEKGYEVKKEYQEEFLSKEQEQLNELSAQTVDIDIYMIPEDEYVAYAKQNDGELTELELDIIEIFVEFKEKGKEENKEE